MIPLSIPNLSREEWTLLRRCIETNWVSSAGPFVKEFEEALQDCLKAKHAVSCINGTTGLFIALKVAGIQPNDEVIVPTLTFIAPVNAVRHVGAEPVFMDCDDYMNMDVEKLREFCERGCRLTKRGLMNKKSSRLVKAIMPVHIFGNPCDMEGLMEVASKYSLKVIEDNAEALGSYYTQGSFKGKFTGTIGALGVLSFNGNKIVTSGNGGMLLTSDAGLAGRARYLINQAKDDPLRYIHNEVGYNFQLSSLQAALGLAQLKKLSRFISIKKKNYGLYQQLLKHVKGVRLLGVPPGTSPNYWFYTLVFNMKRFSNGIYGLVDFFNHNGIQVRPVWYPNHLQRPFKHNQAYRIKNTIYFWKRAINIPCSTNLREEQIIKVAKLIKKVVS